MQKSLSVFLPLIKQQSARIVTKEREKKCSNNMNIKISKLPTKFTSISHTNVLQNLYTLLTVTITTYRLG